jgi:antitoxin component YwqK of YwqJK toxin-antitoxin module
MRQIIFVLIFGTLFGCQQTERKKILSSYKNGNPKIINYFKDNADTLTYRKEVFYESGKQDYVGQFVNGTKDGVWTWWYENGNKKDQCKYENGFYVDTVYHWFKNGNLKQVEIVKGRTVRTDGCCNCNGTIIRYYENGGSKEKFTSLDDKLQGTYVSYFQEGGWKIRTYKNDSLWGPATEHLIDSNKVTIVVGQYEKGKETGLWKWFDKDSVLYLSTIYSNGKVDGEQIHYYPNGVVKQKGKVTMNTKARSCTLTRRENLLTPKSTRMASYKGQKRDERTANKMHVP